ncbi:MAG: alpha,alpha-trehalase TreF [Bacteroidota bacterium]
MTLLEFYQAPLFKQVQEARIFPDGKTFVDCTPKRSLQAIVNDYVAATNNPAIRFSLLKFVEENFEMPSALPVLNYIQPEKKVSQHIKNLWACLKRSEDNCGTNSSLLPLPHAYIVPGGRFREVYYWDSYFTMLGLKESSEVEIIQNMIDNFAYLIRTYGHIPNGNRQYYLSRSQPPFFTLMVELYASIEGSHILNQYIDAIELEYNYWMEGYHTIEANTVFKKLVCLSDGKVLNRYYDELYTPRPESWGDDVETASKSNRSKEIVYNHLRSAAESGWDFSSRWLAIDDDLSTIETSDIIPIDLNSLLYHIELFLASFYRKTNNETKDSLYTKRAKNRLEALQQYCYCNAQNLYFDYHWKHQKRSHHFTLASLFPLWLSAYPASKEEEIAKAAANKIESQLLKKGGVLTTTITNLQQWDAPNGWAPLQWITITALEKTGQHALAETIAKRWLTLNEDVYHRTGKLMEKYNVVETHLEAGGGEYEGQDGFGWTNGVYLALKKKYS